MKLEEAPAEPKESTLEGQEFVLTGRLKNFTRPEAEERIKQLGGLLPGSASVKLGHQIQPSSDTTDVVGVIKAVISAEEDACAHYREIIKATDGEDFVTQDLCIRLLADEEEHLVLFRGFLKEYETAESVHLEMVR